MVSETHDDHAAGEDDLAGYVPEPLTEGDGPDTALIIGRFQPLHEGHRAGLLDPALESYDAVVVGIGVSGDEPTAHDPLTYDEREDVFDAVYGDDDALAVVPVEDQGDDADWIEEVEDKVSEYVPDLDVAPITGNGWTADCFAGHGYDDALVEYDESAMPARDTYSGTAVRELMAADDPDWRDRVPDPAVEVLEEYGIEQRLQDLPAADD